MTSGACRDGAKKRTLFERIFLQKSQGAVRISGRGLTRKQKRGRPHAERETRAFLNTRYKNLEALYVMNIEY